MAMFGRFTEERRKQLYWRRTVLSKLNHNYVGTEHLLLGLIRE